MSILSYVPDGFELRDVQRQMLLEVEAAWPTSDVIVLRADVGVGKSLVLQTIACWQAAQKFTSAIITPRVALQNQYLESFPRSPVLKGASRYKCSEKGVANCADRKLVCGDYCETRCKYTTARDKARGHMYAVFNLQSYVHSQSPRNVILIDEAHTLFDQLSDANSVSLWHHKHGYPEDITHFDSVLMWIEKVRRQLGDRDDEINDLLTAARNEGRDCKDLILEREEIYRDRDKLYNVYQGVKSKSGNLFLEKSEDYFRGKLKPLLRIRPKTLEGLKTPFSHSKTTKMILASATLDQLDIQKLGLSSKRVAILTYGSPFSVEDQPIVVDPVGNMGFKYQMKNLPLMAQRVRETRAKHADTKGLVHMPYALAESFKQHLSEPWVMWHHSDNKEKQLEAFKAAPPGTIFIVSGMNMGIDMAGPDYGWQALAKVMYPSKGDKLVAHWYDEEPKWITWLTTRELIQACGRINRYHGDKGTTYIWDSNFGCPHKHQMGLYQQADRLGFLQKHFKQRITWR